MNKLPISVIVPYSESRHIFFENYCLPSIESNNPAEIIIEDGKGSASYKRNIGFKKATQPYVFFCDDDHILGKNCLSSMYDVIQNNDVSFAYSNYQMIVLHPNDIGLTNCVHTAKEFNFDELKIKNYIDISSLLRVEDFVGFDESIKGLEDWDLWIRVALNNKKGKWINEILYHKYFLDNTVSFKKDERRLIRTIKIKNNIR